MPELPNAPIQQTQIPVMVTITETDDVVIKELTPLHLAWVDFCALGGLITADDGSVKTMTVTQFAEQHGVARQTLNRWKSTIPDFWQLVRNRRYELYKKSRASKVYNGLFLKAAQGDPKAVRLYAEIFDGYQPPAQKHDVKISGLMDLVNIARKRNIIEGEVAGDPAQIPNSTNQQAV